jgi:hypothetical protein
MNKRRVPWAKRATLGVIGTLCLGSLPLLTAGPAQAFSWNCQEYLRGKGYNVPVGGKAAAACSIADRGEGSRTSLDLCLNNLKGLGVKHDHAVTACKKGASR